MLYSLSKIALFSILSVDSAFAAGGKVFRRSPSKPNNAIVQLFEWPWDSVASECPFLASAGYGYVQVSPAQEHIQGSQWWTDYQPVSYKLISKRGGRDQFANMVTTCKGVGVDVIVDVVFNHMSAGSGTGFAGSNYSKYNYPAVPYSSNNFHYCAGNGRAADVSNYNDANNVQNCELVGLADLAQEQTAVQNIIAAFLNDLLSLKVAGFRIDAAKHMKDADIASILALVKGPFYDTQEVIYGAGEAVQPSQYVTTGDVIEFRAPSSVQACFSGKDSGGIAKLVTPTPMGAAWGFVDSSIANYIMANQDTERGGTSLNYQSANNAYLLSGIFMLGFNYGTPTVYSGYNYSNYDAGAPQNLTGFTNTVTCGSNGWRCEHRWPAIANMVAYHNTVGSAKLTNVQTGTNQQIAFGRGSSGFMIINNDNAVWTKLFITSLPAGTYCDIIHASVPTVCNGPSYTVSEAGMLSASIAPHDALALSIGSPANATNSSSAPTPTVASPTPTSTTSSSTSTVTSSTKTASPAGPASTGVAVTFVETASTASGETLKVVGSVSQLGSWSTAAALSLTQPSTNADWRLTVTLPPNTYCEYKFIKVSSSGSVTWESGSNRVYTTPAAGSSVTLFGTFGSTTSSTSAVTGAATTGVPTATTTTSTPQSTGATVTFAESATTSAGEVIKLVGSISQLGGWAPASAVALSNTNSVWSVTLVMPPNTAFQYKFIRVKSGSVVWESDPNRSYTTLSQGSSVILSSSFR